MERSKQELHMDIPGRRDQTKSPALPQQSELAPNFVPAQVMTPNGQILPEKLSLATGESIVDPQHRNRTSLAEEIPQPLVPVATTGDLLAAQVAPGGRSLEHKGRIFYDMSMPTPITTDWQVETPIVPMVDPGAAPILPASHDAMLNAGEGYTIKSTMSGDVLTSVDPPPVPPSLAPNISV